MKKTFCLLIAIFFISICQAQPIELKLRLEQGKTYKQSSESKATINQQVNGQDINMVMTIKGTMSFLVRNASENEYELEAYFEKLGLAIQTPQGPMEFSSDKNGASDLFSMILSEMKNKSFELIMSKNGKVKEVKNVEAIWTSLIAKIDQVPADQREQIKSQLMNAYGAKAIKGNIEMVTAMLPDKPVKKGEKWNIKTKLEAGMSAEVLSEYELIGSGTDYAVIKGNSTIVTADKDAYVQSNGMPMKYNMKGIMTSDIKIDRKSGWIVEAKINQNIIGTAFIKENPQIPNGMTIPLNMKSEMVVTNHNF